MKKLLILILALILALSLSLFAHAEEAVPAEDSYEVGDVIPDEMLGDMPSDENTAEPEENYGAVPDVPPEDDVSMETVLDRVIEWWELRRDEIQSIFGFLITALFTFLWKRLSNNMSTIKSNIITKISETSKTSNDKTNELVEAYNKNAAWTEKLCEKVDLLMAQLKELAVKVDEVDKKTVETEEIEVSIARMLDMAYSHSKLPNGTKDVINTEYAQIEKKVHGYPPAEAEADEKED